MKRWVGIALATVLAAGALAQGTFTIRRPVDDSTVREVVTVRIPRGSIPDGGYIGIMLNGKFVEAVAPEAEGNDYVYRIDTKARDLPDGELTIEVVLYVDFNERPQIVNRSSVTVNLDNYSSIRVPEQGFLLRYRFTPGKELIYRNVQTHSVNVVTQADRLLGARGAQIPALREEFRFLYAVDNAFNVGGQRQGLVRFQPVPDEGKDYATIILTGTSQPTRFTVHEMAPVFQRITDTGREIFSSAPTFVNFDGGASFSRTDLFLFTSLPVLPTKRIRPGDVWQGSFQISNVDIEQKDEEERYFRNLPARGSFEGVEWHMGIPSAKLRYVVTAGPRDLANVRNIAQLEGEAVRVEVEDLVWFALDRGIITRVESNITLETVIEAAAAPGFGGGFGMPGGAGPMGGMPGMPGMPGVSGPPGAPPGMGMPPGMYGGRGRMLNDMVGAWTGGRLIFAPWKDEEGNEHLLQFQPGALSPPPRGGGAGGPAGLPGFGAPRAGMGGMGGMGVGAARQYLQVRLTQIQELVP